MENRNIYKMDDFLIILSYLMILPTLFFAWPWLSTLPEAVEPATFLKSAPLILGARFNTVLLYAVGVVCVQFLGRMIRFKEKQSLKILDALGFSGKSSISQLSMTTGLSESKVRSLAGKLSRISSLEISVEDDKVSRGRKKSIYERPEYKVQDQYTVKEDRLQDGTPIRDSSFQEDRGAAIPGPFPMKERGKGAADKDMPEELKSILKDPTLSMLQKLKTIQEFSKSHPDMNPADRKKAAEFLKPSPGVVAGSGNRGSGEPPRPKTYKLVLFGLLMMSPLWPVAVIMAIIYVIKNKETLLGMKDSVKKQ